MKMISNLILKMMGWKFVTPCPDFRPCIMLVAPHTSNLDFILGRLISNHLGITPVFLIKKDLFFFPFGILLRRMGAIPVDRGKESGIIFKLTEMIKKNNNIVLIITPEGTRKKTEYWKRGFLMISRKMHLPILIGYLDYKKREAGILSVFYPSGNDEEDINTIKGYYTGISGRFTDQFTTGLT